MEKEWETFKERFDKLEERLNLLLQKFEGIRTELKGKKGKIIEEIKNKIGRVKPQT